MYVIDFDLKLGPVLVLIFVLCVTGRYLLLKRS